MRAVERARLPVPAPAAGAARTVRAWRARRSSPPKSRSAHNKARRRPAGSRGGRAGALRRSRGASVPSRCRRSSATDRRPAGRAAAPPAVVARPPHPTAAPCRRCAPSSSRATKARPSDGLRPRRSFSDDLLLAASAPWRGRAALRARRHRRRVSATMANGGAAIACACDFNGVPSSEILHERRVCSTSEPVAGANAGGRVIRRVLRARQIT